MIFVDTSAILALTLEVDKYHDRAIKWQTDEELVTSNLVVIESLSWIRHKAGKEKAVELGKNLMSGNELRIIRVSVRGEQEAWGLFGKLGGRGISMVDCTSFVLMKKLKIKRVFGFDQDFARAGFEVLPG